jgi:hypothetical protein
MPVRIGMAVTPIPVIFLSLSFCFCELVVLLVVLLEVPPIGPVFILIPFMGVIVGFVFVAPVLLRLVMFPFLCDAHAHSQGSAKDNHFDIMFHRRLPRTGTAMVERSPAGRQ